MPVTIRDIAKQSNLSHTTVSRVLNGGEAINIPAGTRERVRQIAREMGYRPNRNARALSMGRTNMVALQLFRVDSPFCAQVARALQSLAWQDGYEILVHEFEGHGENLLSVVDGILYLDRISPPSETDKPGVPHVFMGSFYTETGDYVGVDLRESSEAVMRLLLASGRRRIAFMGRQDPVLDTRDGRVLAYSNAMDGAGHRQERIAVPENTRANGRQAFTQYAEQHGYPDAVFCLNDELAVGCYRAIRDGEKRVPEDVAVVGCDGIDEVNYLHPVLTTIAQPIEEMCRVAWDFLKSRIAAPDQERQHALLSSGIRSGGSH